MSLTPTKFPAKHPIALQYEEKLLRLLLLCRRTHFFVESSIRDLEASNTIDSDVQDR